jgi:hypothetical protein
MSFNLIPFGYHVATGEYLDVSDVSKGKGNGCVCPSCDTPLIARQGDVNDWHFAHASRKVYEQTSQKCEYSFYVSVRMMVRQLVKGRLLISLPAFKSRLEAPLSMGENEISVPFTITPQNQITITDIKVEQEYGDVLFDFIGSVGDFKFLIFLSHKGRELPNIAYDKVHSNAGIIEVSLDEVVSLFFKKENNKSTYKDILLAFIQHDLNSKKWVSHPRYNKAMKEAELVLNTYKSQPQDSNTIQDQGCHQEQKNIIADTKESLMKEKYPSFKCNICKTVWRKSQSGSKDELTCPVCEA